MRSLSPAILFCTAITTLSAADAPPRLPPHVAQFLDQHCFRCHGPKAQKGGLRLDNVSGNFLEGKNADLWHEVTDRMNLGEMPPEEEK